MKTTAHTKAFQYIAANSGAGVTVANKVAPISAVLVLERMGLVTLDREEVRKGRAHVSIVYATLTDAGRAAL